MFIPSSLKGAQSENETSHTSFTVNREENNVYFIKKFKYLRYILTDDHTEDAKIEFRIKKHGLKWEFSIISSRAEIDRRLKYWIYLAGLVNTLLWGLESWNLSQMNYSKLRIFQHAAIKYILNLGWEKIKEKRITNKEVRHCFENIPEINFFINRRTWMYIGKTVRASEQSTSKQLLGAWIHCSRKAGHPQNSLKKHFLMTLKTVLPELSKEGRFQEWFSLATDEGA